MERSGGRLGEDKMGCIRVFLLVFLVGGSILAAVATFAGAGASTVAHPDGISLRDESVRRSGGFFLMYMHTPRYHTGGGLRMGK